jgi:Uncharacterized conserved protein
LEPPAIGSPFSIDHDSLSMVTQPTDVVGVDGCAGGWFVVSATGTGDLTSECYETFSAVVDAHATADRLLVDMPIGLPEADARECDSVARQRLGARGRSVFPVPCRAVVAYARENDDASYERASEIQRENLGAGLSKQAWNITPKDRRC